MRVCAIDGEVIDKSWSDTPEEMAHFVAECNDWYRSHGWLHIPHFLSSATTAALATEVGCTWLGFEANGVNVVVVVVVVDVVCTLDGFHPAPRSASSFNVALTARPLIPGWLRPPASLIPPHHTAAA